MKIILNKGIYLLLHYNTGKEKKEIERKISVNEMKVLSLFDGISCGMVALERAGIPVERYVAYEIEEDAIKISNKNYSQIEHCGDVFKADYTKYEGFDLLIGGSPCTHWSIAKKQNRSIFCMRTIIQCQRILKNK